MGICVYFVIVFLYLYFLFLYLHFCVAGHLESLQGGEPDLDWEVRNILTKPQSSLSLFCIYKFFFKIKCLYFRQNMIVHKKQTIEAAIITIFNNSPLGSKDPRRSDWEVDLNVHPADLPHRPQRHTQGGKISNFQEENKKSNTKTNTKYSSTCPPTSPTPTSHPSWINW